MATLPGFGRPEPSATRKKSAQWLIVALLATVIVVGTQLFRDDSSAPKPVQVAKVEPKKIAAKPKPATAAPQPKKPAPVAKASPQKKPQKKKTAKAAPKKPVAPAAVTAAPVKPKQTVAAPRVARALATTPVEPTYQDPLIDPAIAEDPALEPLEREGLPRLPGAFSAEYRFYDQKTSGVISSQYREQGVSLFAQQQTEGFGRIDLSGIATTVSDGATTTFDGGQDIHLAQRDFAVTESLLMNNDAGAFHATAPRLFQYGSRVRLPTPLVSGAASEVAGRDGSAQVTLGALGVSQGRTFPVLNDAQGGDALGLAGSFRFNPAWSVAGQFWSMQDVTTASRVSEFTSTVASAHHTTRAGSNTQFNLLANDTGAQGLWLDGDTRYGRWRHNGGIYRMDPGIEWIDSSATVLPDIQGLHWLATTQSRLSSFSLNLDSSRTNLDDNPAVPKIVRTTVSTGAGYQVSPSLRTNGYVSAGNEETTSSAGLDDASLMDLRGSVSKDLPVGTSTWTLYLHDRGGAHFQERREASWDHLWRSFNSFSGLRTGVTITEDEGSFDSLEQTIAIFSGNWQYNSLRLGGQFQFGTHDSQITGSGDFTTLQITGNWSISPHWNLSLDTIHNRSNISGAAPLLASSQNLSDRSILLSLRYDNNWGRPSRPVGAVNGSYGRGSVRGLLFLDRNGNGIREPGEPGVPNVVIQLDRGARIQTDGSGEFSFSPVASGAHRILVEPNNIPLPWALKNEEPHALSVRPRETTIVEIPLVTMSPE